MLNSVAAGRQLARSVIVWQGVAVILASLVARSKGTMWGEAVLTGGSSVVIGYWVSALLALGGGVRSAGVALGWLLAGMLLKWLLIILVVVVAVAGFRMPALAVLLGVFIAISAYALANSIRR
ncbi:MAG: hypothetical protein LBL59_03000 [Xanthomonadaceae bacterium]|nr:hypothetical protein [Xanthomonadaceae bacterium]